MTSTYTDISLPLRAALTVGPPAGAIVKVANPLSALIRAAAKPAAKAVKPVALAAKPAARAAPEAGQVLRMIKPPVRLSPPPAKPGGLHTTQLFSETPRPATASRVGVGTLAPSRPTLPTHGTATQPVTRPLQPPPTTPPATAAAAAVGGRPRPPAIAGRAQQSAGDTIDRVGDALIDRPLTGAAGLTGAGVGIGELLYRILPGNRSRTQRPEGQQRTVLPVQ